MNSILTKSLMIGIAMIFISCAEEDREAMKLPHILQLEMIAKEFHWVTRYPGLDGRLYTKDDFFIDGNIYLPEGIPAEISLKSEDYLYIVHVPALEKKSMAIPGMEKKLTLHSKNDSKINLIGNQLCGFKHETLNRLIVFTKPEDFINWSLKKSN